MRPLYVSQGASVLNAPTKLIGSVKLNLNRRTTASPPPRAQGPLEGADASMIMQHLQAADEGEVSSVITESDQESLDVAMSLMEPTELGVLEDEVRGFCVIYQPCNHANRRQSS